MSTVGNESSSEKPALSVVSGRSTVMIGTGLYRSSAYHSMLQPMYNIRDGQKMLRKTLTYFSFFHSLRNRRLTQPILVFVLLSLMQAATYPRGKVPASAGPVQMRIIPSSLNMMSVRSFQVSESDNKSKIINGEGIHHCQNWLQKYKNKSKKYLSWNIFSSKLVFFENCYSKISLFEYSSRQNSAC